MKIELKHLAPYLPYGLKIRCFRKGQVLFIEDLILTGEILDYILSEDANRYNYHKPILRPLSDLDTNSISNECASIMNLVDYKHWPYGDVVLLCAGHFDVFGLIEKGLAIDINTIK